jgi:hypothetical protein
MRESFRVFLFLLEAALFASAGTFLSLLAERGYFVGPGGFMTWPTLAVTLAVLLPPGAGALWLLRRLQPRYTRREARAASITFGLITPIFFWLVLAISEFPGGPSDRPGAALTMELIGATAVIAAVSSFAACSFTMWFARASDPAHE